MVKGRAVSAHCDNHQMAVERLKKRLWALFFFSDELVEPLIKEMDQIIVALSILNPIEYPYTADEAWNRFLHERAGELKQLGFCTAAENNLLAKTQLCRS